MYAVAAAVLEPVGQARVALQGVEVEARLQGLLSDVTVTQTYRNLEDTNIEATYTFPLPLDAVLLELTLDLNGRQLRGVVQPRAEAEERYEGAIDDGDTAVLLQQIEPGTFSMNLGNLLAGETAVIRFRYAQLHRWQGDRLRFHLPTTIAPRYGDPLAAGYAPHQVPEHALTADHGFTLKLEIAGQLIVSPGTVKQPPRSWANLLTNSSRSPSKPSPRPPQASRRLTPSLASRNGALA